MRGFNANDPAVLKQQWQKFYFRGEFAEAGIKAATLENKLRLIDPKTEG